jgi:hypothetical protein
LVNHDGTATEVGIQAPRAETITGPHSRNLLARASRSTRPLPCSRGREGVIQRCGLVELVSGTCKTTVRAAALDVRADMDDARPHRCGRGLARLGRARRSGAAARDGALRDSIAAQRRVADGDVHAQASGCRRDRGRSPVALSACHDDGILRSLSHRGTADDADAPLDDICLGAEYRDLAPQLKTHCICPSEAAFSC